MIREYEQYSTESGRQPCRVLRLWPFGFNGYLNSSRLASSQEKTGCAANSLAQTNARRQRGSRTIVYNFTSHQPPFQSTHSHPVSSLSSIRRTPRRQYRRHHMHPTIIRADMQLGHRRGPCRPRPRALPTYIRRVAVEAEVPNQTT